MFYLAPFPHLDHVLGGGHLTLTRWHKYVHGFLGVQGVAEEAEAAEEEEEDEAEAEVEAEAEAEAAPAWPAAAPAPTAPGPEGMLFQAIESRDANAVPAPQSSSDSEEAQ